MANSANNLINKFNKLPLPAKAAIAVGSGMVLYLLFNRKASTESSSDSTTATDQDGTVYYPYADSNTGMGFTQADNAYNWGYGNGSGVDAITMDELDSIIGDKMDIWGENYMKSLGSKDNDEVGNTWAAGSDNTKRIADANALLYRAQIAYGNATNDTERAAAEKVGKEARALGATDSGADTLWKKNAATGNYGYNPKSSSSSGKGSSSGSSNVMVQGKGGSGKEFTKTTDGTITVKYANGTSKTIKPGESGYSATHSAMNADLGIK